jgi:translation initiation factor 2D
MHTNQETYSAPLRGSDRRKLRQRIVERFIPDSPEEGDLLVPEGLQSMKITTYSGESGVSSSPAVYRIGRELRYRLCIQRRRGILYGLASGRGLKSSYQRVSAPLSITKSRIDVSTVYTLWKRPMLVPFLSTPSMVIPVLLNGADLMAAGGAYSIHDHNGPRLIRCSQSSKLWECRKKV